VQAQAEKQQAQIEKLGLVEDRLGENSSQLDELKERYESFQKDKFEGRR